VLELAAIAMLIEMQVPKLKAVDLSMRRTKFLNAEVSARVLRYGRAMPKE
jgi:hypothetical protein